MNAWLLAGWTMLHFAWVGAIAAAIGAALRLAVRRCAPDVRYAASLAMLAGVACAPVVIACVLASNPALRASAWEPSALSVEGAEGQPARMGRLAAAGDAARSDFRSKAATVGDSLRESQGGASGGATTFVELKDQAGGDAVRSNSRSELATLGDSLRDLQAAETPSLRWGLGSDLMRRVVGTLPLVWLVGAPVTFLLLAAGLVGSRRLTRSGMPLVEGRVAEACARLRSVLGVSRRVALAAVEGLAQPVLVGVVKPTILLPAAALNGWTVEELEMVLVHELAHVRRWDNLVNLAQRVIEAALFFHPCVWLASRQVRRDREECCDAIVVEHTQAPEAYAELLVSVASQLRSEPGRPRPGLRGETPRLARTALALSNASPMAEHALAGRLRRILKLEDEPMWISRRMMGAIVIVMLGISAALYQAALAEPPVAVLGEGAETDATSEVDRAKPQAAENEILSIAYSLGEVETVGALSWLKAVQLGLQFRWLEDKEQLMVTAPRSVHDDIAAMLEHSHEAAKETLEAKTRRERLEIELPKLRQDIAMYQ